MHKEISRKEFLIRIAILTGTFALGDFLGELIGNANNDVIDYFGINEIWYSFPKKDVARRNFSSYGDPKYAYELVHGFYKKDSMDPKEKAKSVFDSTRAFLVNDKTIRAIGTVFQIDKSGYYVTAAHVSGFLTGKNEGYVLDPRSGIANKVSNVLPIMGGDVSLVFAPTGENREPLKGITFSDATPGERLWMYGVIYSEPLFSQGILSGIVAGQNDKEESMLGWGGSLWVKGMIPAGGTSGGPIINAEGEIVAVESGFYMSKGSENVRASYKGARLTPINYIRNVRS